MASTSRQEFEIDGENDVNSNIQNENNVIDSVSTKVKKMRLTVKLFTCFFLNFNLQASSIRDSASASDTPRGSWATFDLRQTASDPSLPGLLDRLAPDVIDNVNKLRRSELQLVRYSG